MSNDPEVIDNFLPEDVFLPIQEFLMGRFFPWYFGEKIIASKSTDKFDYQFIHSFYHLEQGVGVISRFEVIEPIIKKLDCFCLLRAKANLKTFYPGSQDKQKNNYHSDFDKDSITTAILYINTNNGYTIFKDTKQKIDCVANRLVKFNSKLEHDGISSNDSKQRVVINFNYI